jgi:hypothetical protein
MLETLIMDSGTGVHSDEVNHATPRQQEFQALGSDGDVEFAEPYKTPIALQKQRRKPVPATISDLEFEVSEIEESQRKKGSFKGKKGQKKENDRKAWVCFYLID